MDGLGQGEYVLFQSVTPVVTSYFEIINGYRKSDDLFHQNARPRVLKIEFCDGSSTGAEIGEEDECCYRYLEEQKTVTWVKVTIAEAWPGIKYEDTCITKITFAKEKFSLKSGIMN